MVSFSRVSISTEFAVHYSRRYRIALHSQGHSQSRGNTSLREILHKSLHEIIRDNLCCVKILMRLHSDKFTRSGEIVRAVNSERNCQQTVSADRINKYFKVHFVPLTESDRLSDTIELCRIFQKRQ